MVSTSQPDGGGQEDGEHWDLDYLSEGDETPCKGQLIRAEVES